MELKDILFEPRSDIGADDMLIVNQHENLINNNFDEAVALLDSNNFDKGVRASFVNSFQNKIRMVELYLINTFQPNKKTYYSDVEPSIEFMDKNGYEIWAKPWI